MLVCTKRNSWNNARIQILRCSKNRFNNYPSLIGYALPSFLFLPLIIIGSTHSSSHSYFWLRTIYHDWFLNKRSIEYLYVYKILNAFAFSLALSCCNKIRSFQLFYAHIDSLKTSQNDDPCNTQSVTPQKQKSIWYMQLKAKEKITSKEEN